MHVNLSQNNIIHVFFMKHGTTQYKHKQWWRYGSQFCFHPLFGSNRNYQNLQNFDQVTKLTRSPPPLSLSIKKIQFNSCTEFWITS
jgi:hypothetical protein